MRISTALLSVAFLATACDAFVVRPSQQKSASTLAAPPLQAEIRPATEKSQELAFGWDGTTALGGAVEDAKPARMLDEIRAAGEILPPDCEVFNANVEMDADTLKFEDVIELIDTHYETGLIEFKNGDIVNKPGENEGSAKVLSYAALSEMDKDTTLKLWGQYYRDVLKTPDGTDHANIRNFMKSGWDGVPFENGIALTKKNVGENEWDWDAESWIP
mmetsp:Transcript_14527/g.35245  ORF Transcript_14527/g.35245 Transcript_14527/m.35245 type:complete len:217 (-) Transcript_14527:2641-3291(-)